MASMRHRDDSASPREQLPLQLQLSDGPQELKYVLYVRLPFKRGDFVDPPPVRFSCPLRHDIHRQCISRRTRTNTDGGHRDLARFCIGRLESAQVGTALEHHLWGRQDRDRL